MAGSASAATPLHFAGLLVAMHEVDRAASAGRCAVTDKSGSAAAAAAAEEEALFKDFKETLHSVINYEDTDVHMADLDENEDETQDDDCMVDKSVDPEEDDERRELCKVIFQTRQNAEGTLCRCWIAPETWLRLSTHAFVERVVMPVVCSVCFEPRTCGYAKLVQPIVPATWITDVFAKPPYIYSLMYAAYRYNAHETLFQAIGVQTIGMAYNRLIAKRRRKSHRNALNKRDTAVKQGEVLCKYYIEPLVTRTDVSFPSASSPPTDYEETDVHVNSLLVDAPLVPPPNFKSVVMASTAVQNEVYTLPENARDVKRTVLFQNPCYISSVCDSIMQTNKET